MKHSTLFAIAIAMLVAIAVTSCDKENDINMLEAQSLSGTWKTITADEYYTIYTFRPESTGKGTVSMTGSEKFGGETTYYDYNINADGRLSIIWHAETGHTVTTTYDITSISGEKMTWFFRPSVFSSSTEHNVYLEKIGD